MCGAGTALTLSHALADRPAKARFIRSPVGCRHRLMLPRRAATQHKNGLQIMRPARGLDDRPWSARSLVEPVEPGIGVRLHQPGITRQMLLGMLAAAVGRVEEGRRRRVTTAERLIVADVSPQSAGAALALGLHLHGRLVGMNALG